MTTAVIESADQEDNWFGLIERMKEGAVVPVIGPELLDVTVKTHDGSTESGPFYRFVAVALCAQYGIERPVNNGRSVWDLHAAAAAVISEKKENAEKVRRTAARIITTLASNASLSPALSILANVDAFDLFVSITCDDVRRAIGLKFSSGSERYNKFSMSHPRRAGLCQQLAMFTGLINRSQVGQWN